MAWLFLQAGQRPCFSPDSGPVSWHSLNLVDVANVFEFVTNFHECCISKCPPHSRRSLTFP